MTFSDLNISSLKFYEIEEFKRTRYFQYFFKVLYLTKKIKTFVKFVYYIIDN